MAAIFMLIFMSKDIKGGAIVGMFLFLAFGIQLFALQDTEPGKQAFLIATYVIFTTFILWFLTKKDLITGLF